MATQSVDSDICIVGDGAVGKVAALGLSQQGLRVTLLGPAIVSPSVSEDWDVRVFALNHVAHDLLDSLKVWGALDHARVAPVEAMQVYGGTAASDGKLGFDAYGAHVQELAWIVEDKNLNQALDEALKFAQNITYVTGRALRMEVTDTRASVQLEDGDQLTAALLIGADGAQSWVRGQSDIGLDYRSYGQQGVVTNFACEKPHRSVAHQWFDDDLGIIALLPLPGQRVSLVWSAPDHLAEQLLREPLTAVAERLYGYCSEVLGHLTPLVPETIKAFPLRLMRPHSMIAARVVLIGDAGHVVHPMAGHGMNLGFGDVLALLDVLAQREEHRDCGDARVLRRYQRARKEEITLMQLTTDGLARLFGTDLVPLRLARNLGLNLLDRLPVIKRKLISHAMGK
ncbi:UbiH/UbiF family hydroxylase [Undibacterium sp. Jales W-56]|uniref:UbiH/UbiF family hydroxylase n=1 Tax=Undibacterium sp. Jales W-56 TaxID=2897325 RepID=UPI0021D3E579|nr:UbiH/UbiF family hydroxylase [Undibacterium sp. Jales W-56]MCU6435147.1 UbiH/UbiF family hydroxylase [Undibacterium sp. Jales W-56]